MRKYISKIKVFYSDLINVSKLTKTKNKKLKIVFLAITINVMVALDIIIILFFSNFFSDDISFTNPILEYILSFEKLLPIYILLRFFLIYLEKIITTNLQIEIENNLRIYLIEEVFKRGNVSISDAYYYINTLSSQVGGFYSNLAAFFGSLIQILAFSIYLLSTNFEAVVIFAVGSLFLFLPTLYLTKLGRRFAHKAYVYGQEISSEIEKILDNLFLIKILKKTNEEISHYANSLKLFYQSRLNDIKVGTISSIMPNFFTLFFLSILLIFFDFIKYLSLDFVGILLRLFQSLGIFNRNIHTVSSFHVYLEKLYQIEKNKESVTSSNFVISQDLNQDIAIKFTGVDFKYLGADKFLFQKTNLDIYRNKHTIITGPNGSGKSTLIGLLSGIFYPTNGKVEVYSKKVGYISATPLIINSNIKENILYGSDTELSDQDILNLLKEFEVFTDDDSYDLERPISNKTLSTGQMQKISFIRALASQSEILILDESMSNLDIKTKTMIYKILSKRGLTIVNSTHNVDEIPKYDYHISIEKNDELSVPTYLLD